MTPFEKAGYTKDTKFKVLLDWHDLKVGDIVTLDEDDGAIHPYFKTEDGRMVDMYLPNMVPDGLEELEVYEDHTLSLQQRVETLEKELKQLKEGILNACTK